VASATLAQRVSMQSISAARSLAWQENRGVAQKLLSKTGIRGRAARNNLRRAATSKAPAFIDKKRLRVSGSIMDVRRPRNLWAFAVNVGGGGNIDDVAAQAAALNADRRNAKKIGAAQRAARTAVW